MEPVLKKVVQEEAAKREGSQEVALVKVDVDTSPKTAEKYGVSFGDVIFSLRPTTAIFDCMQQ